MDYDPDTIINAASLFGAALIGSIGTSFATKIKGSNDVTAHKIDAASESARLKLERDKWYADIKDDLLSDARDSLAIYKQEIEDIHKLYEKKEARHVKEIADLHAMYARKIKDIHKEYAAVINRKNREIAILKGDTLLNP